MSIVRTGLSEEPLDVNAAIGEASTPSCGAVASFIGTVRETPAVTENEGKAVTRLDYEAHPTLAASRLEVIAQEAATKWALERVVAVHRVGTCELGQPTVVVACGAPHRAEALEACRWLIDELKASVPIWKKEVYADGSTWVGTEGA